MHKKGFKKDEIEEALNIPPESTSKPSFNEALKNAQKCEINDAFYAGLDDTLDSAIKGTSEVE